MQEKQADGECIQGAAGQSAEREEIAAVRPDEPASCRQMEFHREDAEDRC